MGATAFSIDQPRPKDISQSLTNLQSRTQAGGGEISPVSQAVFNEVKSRLLAVANRHSRYQPDQYVWPPPIELTGSSEFDAYACRCHIQNRSVDVPRRDGKFLPHIIISQAVVTDLIESDPDRLALVMGHEIAHIMLGHVCSGCENAVVAISSVRVRRLIDRVRRYFFPRYPIPLARGRGHLEIKQSMINLADEVYVVATLGKIFAGIENTQVQAMLYDFVQSQKDGGDIYHEVQFDAEPIRQITPDGENKQTNKIRLVTTSRKEGRVLSRLSQMLEDVGFLDTLNVTDQNFEKFKRPFFLSEFNDVSNLMFSFDDVQDDLSSQIRSEFPHEESLKDEFLRCFHLSDAAIKEFFKTL